MIYTDREAREHVVNAENLTKLTQIYNLLEVVRDIAKSISGSNLAGNIAENSDEIRKAITNELSHAMPFMAK